MSPTHRIRATRTVLGQPSWRVATPDVELFVTRTGGHIAPVTFLRREKTPVQPFSVAPWATEKVDLATPAILKVLRGDFFCAPFGGNATSYRGEQHPVHGDTANLVWKAESLAKAEGRTTLHLSMATQTRPGRVDKYVSLVDGHQAVYQRHVLSGMAGAMDVGHHATLRFPDAPGSGIVSTSPFVYGQVLPEMFEHPSEGGYQALRPGAEFESLRSVPAIDGSVADLTRYPARRGFEDLVMVVADPAHELAWTAVTFPKEGYVWFALKNRRLLASTVLWISNAGRHYAPWSGRHASVMGLEEVTAYFHLGLAASAAPNPLSRRGIPTCLRLKPEEPVAVPYVMAVARVPQGFDRVKRIAVDGEGVVLEPTKGKGVRVALDVGFLLAV